MLLDWEGHNKALSKKLLEFLEEEYLVDFNVTCHGQQKKVHKFVLAFLFPILKESLRSSATIPCNHQVLAMDLRSGQSLKIPDDECLSLDNIADHPEDMDYLIQFAYTGKATVPNKHADCLMHIADTMEVNSLKESLDQWSDKNKCKQKNDRKDVTCPTASGSQWHDKRKLVETTEQNDVTSLSRLRPRTQIKMVIDKSVDIVVSEDDDLDFICTTDEESSQSKSFKGNESFKDSSYDGKQLISKSTKRKTQKNRVSQKRRREVDSHSKMSSENQKSTDEGVSQEQTMTDNIKEKILKCRHCDYVAKRTSQLNGHMRRHTVRPAKIKKRFTCRSCKKEFESANLLRNHRDSKCGTEPLICKYCGHESRKKNAFLNHITAKHHVDANGNPLEKNLRCPDCNFVCYVKHQLRCHFLTKHERLDKLKCKDCDYTASYMAQLMQHDRIMHQNRKDYMCDKCGNRYQTRGSLNHHVLIQHKGMKPYKCNICNAEYSDRISMKVHMQRHEGKVEYMHVCHICGYGSRTKFQLRIHIQKKHDIELEGGKPKRTSTSDLESGNKCNL